MIRYLLVGIGAIVAFGSLHFRKAPPDLSSPKSAVRSYIGAISEHDTNALIACVKGGKSGEALEDFGRLSKSGKLEVKEIVAETEGDSAKVAVEYTGTGLSQVEILHVVKNGDSWKILPDAPFASTSFNDEQQARLSMTMHPLRLFASLVAQDEAVVRATKMARQAAQAAVSLSNSKQLATGMLMYIQDYDEMCPYPAKSYHDLVYPYVKNEGVFKAPLAVEGETISYSMNRNLEGVSMAAIAEPASTVLLYEGKGQKPLYRYDGKTVIAFADGHAKLLTEEQVKTLAWSDKAWVKPKPAPVKPKAMQKPKAKSGGKKKGK